MLRINTAGESHGPALIALLEGMPAGLPLAEEDLLPDLIRRRTGNIGGTPYRGASARMKIENDSAKILSGVMSGRTTGAPIALLVENADHVKWKGRAIEAMTIPRPGHGDLVSALKFGYDDLRPGLERASARETAARVAACGVCRKLLRELGIVVGSYIIQIGDIRADLSSMGLEERFEKAEASSIRCPDLDAERRMSGAIDSAMKNGETIGGVWEVAAQNVPPGLGSMTQWDRRISSRLGAALLGIPAIKGVEIGDGFRLAAVPGTQAQDAILLEGRRLTRASNHAGGVEAGITNGQPVIVRAAMKPIPTTIAKQRSINLATGEVSETKYERSDYCTAPRAAIIGEAMVCLVLADAILEKCGGDSMAELKQRYNALPKGDISDFSISPEPKTFWP